MAEETGLSTTAPARLAETTGLTAFAATGMFPAATFMAYVITGIALGRLPLHTPRIQVRLLTGGPALAVAGYGTAQLLLAHTAATTQATITQHAFFHGAVPSTRPTWLLTSVPHSGTTFEILGSTGVGMAVLGGCLALAPHAHRACHALTALGSMALSAYVAHVLAIWGLRAAGWWHLDHRAELFVTAALLGALLWRCTHGHGPLERALAATVDRLSPHRGPHPAVHTPPSMAPRSVSTVTRSRSVRRSAQDRSRAGPYRHPPSTVNASVASTRRRHHHGPGNDRNDR